MFELGKGVFELGKGVEKRGANTREIAPQTESILKYITGTFSHVIRGFCETSPVREASDNGVILSKKRMEQIQKT